MKKFEFWSRLKKISKDLPIRRKLVLSFLILIIFPITLIGFFSFYRSSELLKQKTEQYMKDILMETGIKIELKLQEVERLSFQMISSTQMQSALKIANNGFKDEYEKIYTEKAIDSQLKACLSSNADIAAIQVLTNSGITYCVNPASISVHIEDADKDKLDGRNGSVYWFDTNPATRSIVVGRTINSLVDQHRVGFIFIYLRESTIFDIYKNTELFKNGEFLIANSEGRIVSYKDKKILNDKTEFSTIGSGLDKVSNNFLTSKIGGKNYYIAFRTIGQNFWKIIILIPAIEYEKDIIWLRDFTAFICVLCCLAALIISIGISESISRPVRRLSAMMVKVGKGNFNVYSSYESKNEIGILSSHFNMMVEQVQQLIQEVYQEQYLKQRAELKALRMQINPHFLYNTLESINWMARIKGVPEIGKMVKALGDLMRASISGDDFVLIDEEIRNINNYLTIQKFRYGDRFNVVVDIRDDIRMVKIPKLVLQPIVENAIVHGIENMVGNGEIKIKGAAEEKKVILEVTDNGAGINEELIPSILSGNYKSKQSEDHTRIGLINVDRRIKIYYGQEYGLSISSTPGAGTCVKINIPLNAVAGNE